MKPTDEEIEEERRRIRYLRMLVDLTRIILYQGNLSYEEALELVANTKEAALKLFPGKEETYNLIYRPRFERVLWEVYGKTETDKILGEGK